MSHPRGQLDDEGNKLTDLICICDFFSDLCQNNLFFFLGGPRPHALLYIFLGGAFTGATPNAPQFLFTYQI